RNRIETASGMRTVRGRRPRRVMRFGVFGECSIMHGDARMPGRGNLQAVAKASRLGKKHARPAYRPPHPPPCGGGGRAMFTNLNMTRPPCRAKLIWPGSMPGHSRDLPDLSA